MKRLMLAILIISLILFSGCAEIEKDTDIPHSEDWKQIEELLYQQCKGRIREDWDIMGPLYSFTEDSFEYKDLKRIAKLAFRTVSVLSCDYTITKIKFNGDIAFVSADHHVKELERKNPRNKREVTVSLPPKDDPNFLKMIKLDGEWKFCPAEDCFGEHSDKISCEDGTMVEDEKDCPILDIEFYSEKNLEECVENQPDIERVLHKNIGPFLLNPASISASINDTKLYKASENKIGKFDIVTSYSADYQQMGNNKRMFSMAYLEVGDELDFKRYVKETHDILRELLEKYNNTREEDIEFGGTIANIVYFPTARQDMKTITITKRAYIYIPEKNVIYRFLFNDWLVDKDVSRIIGTYFNNLCEV
ncbi:MAG: hypothetical protein KAT43_04400 [Nanoarchaeota archaeon]|nr:hypothetical protein [Nanoarchaeota archaeon]